MTRMSLFETMEDLHLNQLAQTVADSEALFNDVVLSDGSESHAPLKMMWQGYEVALAAYSVAGMAVLSAQHRTTSGGSSLALANNVEALRRDGDGEFVIPPWFEDADVLRSHRSNLVRRFSEYRGAWKGTPERMPYIWPVCDAEGGYELRLSKFDKSLLAKGERSIPKKILERISNA